MSIELCVKTWEELSWCCLENHTGLIMSHGKLCYCANKANLFFYFFHFSSGLNKQVNKTMESRLGEWILTIKIRIYPPTHSSISSHGAGVAAKFSLFYSFSQKHKLLLWIFTLWGLLRGHFSTQMQQEETHNETKTWFTREWWDTASKPRPELQSMWSSRDLRLLFACPLP